MATKNKARPFAQDFSGESKTQQHFKDSCNVNNIVAHYRATGIDPHADRLKQQTFGYATSKSFLEASRDIAEIRSAFQDLAAEERAQFGNDAGLWLDSLTVPITIDDLNVEPDVPEDVSPPAEPTPETLESESN